MDREALKGYVRSIHLRTSNEDANDDEEVKTNTDVEDEDAEVKVLGDVVAQLKVKSVQGFSYDPGSMAEDCKYIEGEVINGDYKGKDIAGLPTRFAKTV